MLWDARKLKVVARDAWPAAANAAQSDSVRVNGPKNCTDRAFRFRLTSVYSI
jgi:hypothetical protein